MGHERRGEPVDGEAFSRALSSLKERGMTVLVVGAEACGAHEAVCRRLLGDEGRPRHRVFVSVDADSRTHVESIVSADGSVRSIDYEHLRARTADDPLGALNLELIRTIDEVEDEAGTLAPGELRVCVDSVRPLLDVHDTEAVFRTIHAMTARIVGASGFGHVHLPVDASHEAATLFPPLFDAVVDVRTDGSVHEHRWRLRDEGVTSGWIPVG